MKTCQNCGGRINKRNKVGYCTRTRECARLGERMRQPLVGSGKGNWARSACLNCGGPTRARYGYCSETEECRRLVYASLRYDTFLAYGGASCVCCGETRLERLSLDHVNGDGHLERDRLSKGGASYLTLRAQDFPDRGRYQVLCHNCNMEKGVKTKCPCQERSILVKLAEQGSPLFKR